MVLARLGRRVEGRLQPLNLAALKTGVPNQVYEIHVETSPVSEAGEVASALAQLQARVPGVRVLYVEVGSTMSRMQLIADPTGFSWLAVLAALPQILTWVGIAIIAIAVFLVIGAIPIWAVYLALGGAFLIFGLPWLIRKGRR